VMGAAMGDYPNTVKPPGYTTVVSIRWVSSLSVSQSYIAPV